MKFWDEVKEIKKGDIVFLRNIDTDILFGPFTAENGGGLNLEPDAWGGRFPAQVKVGWEVISLIKDASKRFSFLKAPTIKLTKEQGEELLKALLPRRLEVPSNIKSEIQQLDAEIHSLAHRIEEATMHGRGHPADREIELDKLKAEFVAKMKDYVWAVRKLDKQTGLLDLPSNR